MLELARHHCRMLVAELVGCEAVPREVLVLVVPEDFGALASKPRTVFGSAFLLSTARISWLCMWQYYSLELLYRLVSSSAALFLLLSARQATRRARALDSSEVASQ